MADDDEIDVLGDFSFNSCLAQNNQGIPSCSSREDTVHPQWFLDSTATNWYDSDREKRLKLGSARKLSGNSALDRHSRVRQSSWNQAERDLLVTEMAKYGRNVHKISQTLKTKTAAEIQALIEAEHGINLDTPSFGLVKNVEQDDVPNVVQEEIVTDESSISNVLSLVTTGSPTIAMPKKLPFRKKNNKNFKNPCNSNVHPKPDLLFNSSEIFYDDDLIIGSTESIGSDVDPTHIITQNKVKQHKEKVKAVKKIGNHRRKVSGNFDRGRPRTSSKELVKSPQGRKKESSLSEDNTRSPKLQIVLGSGQALPVSEGEQVIKIEKKKDSESDSDIDVDVDSDDEGGCKREQTDVVKEEPQCSSSDVPETPIAVPLTNFAPMPKRRRKINLFGSGGCTIMHTAAGDLYRVSSEPRRARAPRRRVETIELLPCPYYGPDQPAPYSVVLGVSALVLMEAHAHTSRHEVMGLLGGRVRPAAEPCLELTAYRPAAAAAGATHCEMDPVSQAEAGAWLRARGLRVLGWHHSHPAFAALPSAQDAATQRALQALDPFVALVTSQRPAATYRCFRVWEDGSAPGSPRALRVRVARDVRAAPLLRALRRTLHRAPHALADTCPLTKLTYRDKCMSSVRHHLSSAGYAADDPAALELLAGLRDVLRAPPTPPTPPSASRSPDTDWGDDTELAVPE